MQIKHQVSLNAFPFLCSISLSKTDFVRIRDSRRNGVKIKYSKTKPSGVINSVEFFLKIVATKLDIPFRATA